MVDKWWIRGKGAGQGDWRLAGGLGTRRSVSRRWRSRKVGKDTPLRPRKLGNYSSPLESQIFNDEPHIHLETASFNGNFG